MSAGLNVRGLTARLGGRVVVEGVDLDLRPGACVALVGASGSGKSTVARALVGLCPIAAGEVRLDGAPYDPTSRASRRRVQMLLQDPYASLDPLRDVADHLARPLLLHGHATRATVRDHAAALLRDVGLSSDLLGRRPTTLSGGQRQRVALARALAVRPEVLLADEPTSMLDASLRGAVMALLDDLRRSRGLALLLITHDLASARLAADDLVVLHAGRVVERGPTADVIAAPLHPYTDALVRSASLRRPPDPVDPSPPRACAWADRCDRRAAACDAPPLELTERGPRAVRCRAPLHGPA